MSYPGGTFHSLSGAREDGWSPHGGQNLADGSTTEVVPACPVVDGVTSQVGSYQPRLFVGVEAVLGMRSDSNWAIAFGLVE
jgi:hypothetical protein